MLERKYNEMVAAEGVSEDRSLNSRNVGGSLLLDSSLPTSSLGVTPAA